MLKKRLIPKLLLKSVKIADFRQLVLVSTIKFERIIEIGDPVSQARIYESQLADELIFLDLDARGENREPMYEVIKRVSEEIFMPFTFGGGINSISDIRMSLLNGADKVSLNTAAVNSPDLINSSAKIFGNQCIVISIDAKKNSENTYSVFINGGKTKTNLDPVKWAIECEKRGAGEILLTSIDNDGVKNGLAIDIIKKVTNAVSIPVIASGGCGSANHFIEGFKDGKADAISAGTYFCFKDENPMQTRSQILNAGIPIRIHT